MNRAASTRVHGRMQPASEIRTSYVLVVGNPAEVRLVFEEPLRGIEAIVEHVASLGTAVQRLKSSQFDAVLVDLDNPASQDANCVHELRLARPDAKVILIVSRSTPELVISAMRQQAFSYFSRPVDILLMRDMLGRALRLQSWSNGIELISASPEYLSFRLRCRLTTAERLTQFMKEIPIELSEEDRDEVAQALRELLLNAMEHGGKMDPDEWVRVSRIRTRRTVVYHIADPGLGFSRNQMTHAAGSHDDPLQHLEYREQKRLRPGGFGILIATALVDEVIYNELGNEVLMIKHLE